MKRILIGGFLGMVGLLVFASFHAHGAHAYTNSRMIDDQVFDNVNSMTEQQIRDFINSRPNTCLSRVGAGYGGGNIFPEPMTYWDYSGSVDAARVIYKAAQAWGINPQVILATLQKEQALLTDSDCLDGQGFPTLHKAMGQGCSEGGPCPSAPYDGFSQQVMKGAWQLKFNEERSKGNTSWDGDGGVVYSGFMTQGSWARCATCAVNYYSGNATIDGQSTFIETAATAGLYSYTPHLNQSFPGIFENYFGSTFSSLYYACHNATNVGGALGGGHIVPNRTGVSPDKLTLVFDNNTASACIEMHTWADPSYGTWYSNIATNHPAVNPADDEIITADTNGDGRDEFYLVKLNNTVSGKIEIHQWDSSDQQWSDHIATNHPVVSSADNRVIAADLNGDGKDEFSLIKYRNNGSNKIEVHTWAAGEQSWLSHIATNHPAVDPAEDVVVAANTVSDGGSADKLVLVKYRNGLSGHIEVHTWLPGEQGWYSNVATNHPVVDPADDGVIAANIFGNKDQLLLIKYRNSVSGKVEVHTWGPEQQSWLSNLATNLPSINP